MYLLVEGDLAVPVAVQGGVVGGCATDAHGRVTPTRDRVRYACCRRVGAQVGRVPAGQLEAGDGRVWPAVAAVAVRRTIGGTQVGAAVAGVGRHRGRAARSRRPCPRGTCTEVAECRSGLVTTDGDRDQTVQGCGEGGQALCVTQGRTGVAGAAEQRPEAVRLAGGGDAPCGGPGDGQAERVELVRDRVVGRV